MGAALEEGGALWGGGGQGVGGDCREAIAIIRFNIFQDGRQMKPTPPLPEWALGWKNYEIRKTDVGKSLDWKHGRKI